MSLTPPPLVLKYSTTEGNIMLHMSNEIVGNNHENPPGFPIWSCRHSTKIMLESYDRNIRKKAIRNCASSFIKRKDVRDYIFGAKGTQCYLCGSDATQIDHKIPVAWFADDRTMNLSGLNAFSNLFPICAKCNYSKRDNLK